MNIHVNINYTIIILYYSVVFMFFVVLHKKIGEGFGDGVHEKRGFALQPPFSFPIAVVNNCFFVHYAIY